MVLGLSVGAWPYLGQKRGGAAEAADLEHRESPRGKPMGGREGEGGLWKRRSPAECRREEEQVPWGVHACAGWRDRARFPCVLLNTEQAINPHLNQLLLLCPHCTSVTPFPDWNPWTYR